MIQSIVFYSSPARSKFLILPADLGDSGAPGLEPGMGTCNIEGVPLSPLTLEALYVDCRPTPRLTGSSVTSHSPDERE